jgi:hypothetical protein
MGPAARTLVTVVAYTAPLLAQSACVVTAAGIPWREGWSGLHLPLNSPAGVSAASDGGVWIADTDYHRVRRLWPNGTITTVAGDGLAGFRVNGGPASRSRLNFPVGVFADLDGGVWIADNNNHRVRRMWPNGTISTVAGTGVAGYSGTGGPASSAQLSGPYGVAAAADGGVWIADSSNHRIRRVWPNGTITTVAGTGVYGYSGDGGPARSAQLWFPSSVSVAADSSLWLADFYNHRVRRVWPNGTITTVAGTGTGGDSGDGGPATSAQLNRPIGVSAAVDGGVWVTDFDNHRVRRVWPNGTITTAAGALRRFFGGDGGPGTLAYLRSPHGVSAAPDGGAWIADTYNHRVRRVWPNGTITTEAGTGVAGFNGDGGLASSTQLNRPFDVSAALDGGVWIADTYNNRVRRVWPNGTIVTAAGTGLPGHSGDGGPGSAAQIEYPPSVSAAADGSVWIADSSNHRIRRLWPNGTIITAAGIVHRGYSGDGGPGEMAHLNYPQGVAAATDGGAWIADRDNSRVRRLWSNGTITTAVSHANWVGVWPVGVSAAWDGGCWIADARAFRVGRLWPNGTVTTVAGTGAAGFNGDGAEGTMTQLTTPTSVSAALDGSVWIADHSSRVRRLLPPTQCGLSGTLANVTCHDFEKPLACIITITSLLPVPTLYGSTQFGPCSTTVFPSEENGGAGELHCPVSPSHLATFAQQLEVQWSTQVADRVEWVAVTMAMLHNVSVTATGSTTPTLPGTPSRTTTGTATLTATASGPASRSATVSDTGTRSVSPAASSTGMGTATSSTNATASVAAALTSVSPTSAAIGASWSPMSSWTPSTWGPVLLLPLAVRVATPALAAAVVRSLNQTDSLAAVAIRKALAAAAAVHFDLVTVHSVRDPASGETWMPSAPSPLASSSPCPRAPVSALGGGVPAVTWAPPSASTIATGSVLVQAFVALHFPAGGCTAAAPAVAPSQHPSPLPASASPAQALALLTLPTSGQAIRAALHVVAQTIAQSENARPAEIDVALLSESAVVLASEFSATGTRTATDTRADVGFGATGTAIAAAVTTGTLTSLAVVARVGAVWWRRWQTRRLRSHRSSAGRHRRPSARGGRLFAAPISHPVPHPPPLAAAGLTQLHLNPLTIWSVGGKAEAVALHATNRGAEPL